MYAKTASFFCYLIAGWLLSGRVLYALALAAGTTVAALLEYGWGTIQWFGIAFLLLAFLKVSGLVPFWPI